MNSYDYALIAAISGSVGVVLTKVIDLIMARIKDERGGVSQERQALSADERAFRAALIAERDAASQEVSRLREEVARLWEEVIAHRGLLAECERKHQLALAEIAELRVGHNGDQP